MSIPVDRKILIISAVDPNQWVGAENRTRSAIKSVVLGGAMRKSSLCFLFPIRWWSAKIVDGLPRLVLDDIWYSTKFGDQLMAELMVNLPTVWVIEYVTEEYFTIKATDIDTVWTLSDSEVEPKDDGESIDDDLSVLTPITPQVALSPFNPGNPTQLWKFQFIED